MKTIDTTKRFVRDSIRTIPAIAFFILRAVSLNRKSRTSVRDPLRARVLVIATNAIGDTITTLPAIERVIRAQRPVKVDILARPKSAPLFKFVPGVRVVNTIEKLVFPFNVRSLVANIRTLDRLRSSRYGSVVVFSSNFWTAWMAYLIGAEKRYGFSRREKVGLLTISDFGFLLTHDKKQIDSVNFVAAHLEFSNWLLQETATVQIPRLLIEPKTSGNGTSAARGRPLVILNPFASQAIKEWPLDNWKMLAESLLDHSIDVTVSCEADQKNRVLEAFANTQVGITAGASLAELIVATNDADVIVTNDSGPLHLAYALDKPVIAVFGPTDPQQIIPRGANVSIVKKEMDCAPCYQLGVYDRCPLSHHRCLVDIEPAAVVDRVLGCLTNARTANLHSVRLEGAPALAAIQ